MARNPTSLASNSGAGETLGSWGHSSRHAEERAAIDEATAFIGAEFSGSVETPAINTAIRGRASGGSSWDHPTSFILTNKSGGSVAAGDVVVIDTANDGAFAVTTTADNPLALGVAMETIANNAAGPVAVSGYIASVAVTAATRGQYLATSTTAKKAVSSASITAGTFGMAMSSASGGFCQAIIFPQINRLITTDQIAANAATKAAAADGNNNFTTSSSSMGDVTGASVTFTTVANSVVEVTWNVDHFYSETADKRFAIAIKMDAADTAKTPFARAKVAYDEYGVSMTEVWTNLSAGSHTAVGRARSVDSVNMVLVYSKIIVREYRR